MTSLEAKARSDRTISVISYIIHYDRYIKTVIIELLNFHTSLIIINPQKLRTKCMCKKFILLKVFKDNLLQQLLLTIMLSIF